MNMQTPFSALEIRGLMKSFDRPAVDNLDLTVRTGEFYCLLGPNGAGKTCLLYTSPSPRDGLLSRMPSSA